MDTLRSDARSLTRRSATSGAPVTGASGMREVLALHRTMEDSFRSQASGASGGRLYGGAVAAQAFLAAAMTVSGQRTAHHLTAQFLHSGDKSLPIDFRVTTDRDGRSFSARRVVARQRGRVILTLAASFQVAEKGVEHQLPDAGAVMFDETPGPGSAEPCEDVRGNWLEGVMDRLDVDMYFPGDGGRNSGGRGDGERFLVRTRRAVGDDPLHQQVGIVYLSDLLMVSAALAPHGLPAEASGMQFATVNHSLWFHSPARPDDWLLYDIEGAWTGGARGLSHGRLFDRTGRLCATTAQEALLRFH